MEIVVKVTVKPGGDSQIKVVEGTEGVECESLTAGLEAALGAVQDRNYTEDYFKVKHQRERLRQ